MKKLYEGNMFWETTTQAFDLFPPVCGDIETEVLIIGGGMSGNLCAYELAGRGHDVVVCEWNRLAEGSSAANTGMLQYSSDDSITALAKTIGEEKAVLFYKMCLEGMKNLFEISKIIKSDNGFYPCNSIYLASVKRDVPKLEKEYAMLRKHGFPVNYLTQKDLVQRFGIEKPAALETSMDAEVNPYKFLQAVIKKNVDLNVRYYEKTRISRIRKAKAGYQIGTTDGGHQIMAKQVVFATGYTRLYPEIKSKMEINRTYALASTISKSPLWKGKEMFWETSRPYLYFRTTEDNRVVAGGLDKKTNTLVKSPARIEKNNLKILRKVRKFFPDLDVKPEYSWDALFGISKDGIPFVGRTAKNKNRYYLLGFGGNGTAYSMAGATIIADLIEEKENPYAEIVAPDRP